MPRRARLRIAGMPLHVIQRGNNRSCCFPSGRDYGVYLGMLEELSSLFGCTVHAYVLMTNHVHLLVTPACEEGVSTLMKHLGQRYVQHVNRNNERTGSLWEGRFRSSIIDSSNYLLRCQRYIELNPVRAGMVARADDYPWSSYRTNALGIPSKFLFPHPEYLALGANENERRETYRALFERQPCDDELRRIRAAANRGFALGSESFLAHIERMLGRRVSRTQPS